jgi:hypothetical protein
MQPMDSNLPPPVSKPNCESHNVADSSGVKLEGTDSTLKPLVTSSAPIPLNPPKSVRTAVDGSQFRVPLPPKQLIKCDSRYAQADGVTYRYATADGDSYSSLPDNFSSLSCSSQEQHTIQRSHSLSEGLLFGAAIGHEVNPFAVALGIDSNYRSSAGDVSAASSLFSGQKQPAPPGVSGESFAALNKNSVSALMEYAQSRHLEVEIKCINSSGPPHRPV